MLRVKILGNGEQEQLSGLQFVSNSFLFFTFERNSLLRVADFPFVDGGSFAAALDSSLAFAGLTAASPLASVLGGSGGGGGGAGIPLGAAGGSDTCATCSEQRRCFQYQERKSCPQSNLW